MNEFVCVCVSVCLWSAASPGKNLGSVLGEQSANRQLESWNEKGDLVAKESHKNAHKKISNAKQIELFCPIRQIDCRSSAFCD